MKKKINSCLNCGGNYTYITSKNIICRKCGFKQNIKFKNLPKDATIKQIKYEVQKSRL